MALTTFARLLLEIRHRAASLPDDVPRAMSLEQAAREVLETVRGSERDRTRQIMAVLLGIGDGGHFDGSMLDALTPELLFRLDMITAEILELGRQDDAVGAIRAALIRRA